jgi:uncharacterized protein
MSLDQLRSGLWLNPPPVFQQSADSLTLETGLETDFWRDTLYGFRRDSGHALLVPVLGDFTAYLSFQANYEELYDQAGLMLRQDEAHWVKAGIEFSDGILNMSVVVTSDKSDWSTCALSTFTTAHRLRWTRRGDAVVIQFRNAENRWQLLRVAPFPRVRLILVPWPVRHNEKGFR